MKKLLSTLFAITLLSACDPVYSQNPILNNHQEPRQPRRPVSLDSGCQFSTSFTFAPYVLDSNLGVTACDTVWFTPVNSIPSVGHELILHDLTLATTTIYHFGGTLKLHVEPLHFYNYEERNICSAGDTSIISYQWSFNVAQCNPQVSCDPLDSTTVETPNPSLAIVSLFTLGATESAEVRYGLTPLANTFSALSTFGSPNVPLWPLLVNTTYYYTSQRNCGSGYYATVSPVKSFTTPPSEFTSLEINPNPVQSGNQINVELNSTGVGLALVIVQSVNSRVSRPSGIFVRPGTGVYHLPSTGLPSGNYVVSVQRGYDKISTQIIIQ